jgi:hypothetical protein
MMLDKGWARVTMLALSLPSTIIATAILVTELIKRDVVTSLVGWSIFVFIIVNTVILLVIYAYRSKNR